MDRNARSTRTPLSPDLGKWFGSGRRNRIFRIGTPDGRPDLEHDPEKEIRS
jgi:hypothetical protein